MHRDRFFGLCLGLSAAAAMADNKDWSEANDQNATWEVARRLHTAKTNTPETATDLSMDYDITSAYKASFKPLERLGRDGWRRMDAPEPESVTIDRPLPARSPRRILVDA